LCSCDGYDSRHLGCCFRLRLDYFLDHSLWLGVRFDDLFDDLCNDRLSFGLSLDDLFNDGFGFGFGFGFDYLFDYLCDDRFGLELSFGLRFDCVFDNNDRPIGADETRFTIFQAYLIPAIGGRHPWQRRPLLQAADCIGATVWRLPNIDVSFYFVHGYNRVRSSDYW
jgi:hypothetical protein